MTAAPLVVPRDDLMHFALHGERAASALDGLVTNDIGALPVGAGCYTAALSPKGRLVADLVVMRDTDRILTTTTREGAPGWREILRKYVNPRLARHGEEATDSCDLVGDDAAALLASSGIDGAAALTAWTSGSGSLADVPVRVLAVPQYGVPAFRLMTAAGTGAAVVATLVAGGATAATPDALEILRVEAGWPRYGADMDDGMLAQEANMDALQAISYTKGCYTGQEVVARLHFRGHVNRHLRGLRLTRAVPRGTPLQREDGSVAGDVRSVVTSPRLGVIALGLVRREVASGGILLASDRGETVHATVVDLPFTR